MRRSWGKEEAAVGCQKLFTITFFLKERKKYQFEGEFISPEYYRL